jgi:Aph-1 protein
MTTPALTIGAALMAFGPMMALFWLLVYPKAQLVIVATGSAFFFLLSAVASGLCYTFFHVIGLVDYPASGSGDNLSNYSSSLNNPFIPIVPAVFTQFVFRCVFVSLYHRVETVIQASLQKHLASGSGEGEINQNDSDGSDNATDRPLVAARSKSSAQAPQFTQESWIETVKLRAELNDASTGIAAGVGFGGMHGIMLYGSLLSSEIMNNVGILYQDSCPGMPSLILSAIYAFSFSILDIFWMLLTFFGMRRRAIYHRGQASADREIYRGMIGAYLGDSRNGGNYALLLVLVTHLATALCTTTGYFDRGCVVSIPAVLSMVFVTAYIFWAGCGRIYMPPPVKLPPGVRIESDSVIGDVGAAPAAFRAPPNRRMD